MTKPRQPSKQTAAAISHALTRAGLSFLHGLTSKGEPGWDLAFHGGAEIHLRLRDGGLELNASPGLIKEPQPRGFTAVARRHNVGFSTYAGGLVVIWRTISISGAPRPSRLRDEIYAMVGAVDALRRYMKPAAAPTEPSPHPQ